MFKNLTVQVLLAAIMGVLLGLLYNYLTPQGIASITDTILFLKQAFLTLLKMLIAPMIFFSLIGGIISIGNVVKLRQLGGITVAYYLCTTTLAIILALTVVLFVSILPNIMGSVIANMFTPKF